MLKFLMYCQYFSVVIHVRVLFNDSISKMFGCLGFFFQQWKLRTKKLYFQKGFLSLTQILLLILNLFNIWYLWSDLIAYKGNSLNVLIQTDVYKIFLFAYVIKTCTHKQQHQKIPKPNPQNSNPTNMRKSNSRSKKPDQSNWCVSHIGAKIPVGWKWDPQDESKGGALRVSFQNEGGHFLAVFYELQGKDVLGFCKASFGR